MIKWDKQIEQIHLFQLILEWQKSNIQNRKTEASYNLWKTTILVAKTAPFSQRTFNEIAQLHNALNFKKDLKIFLQKLGFQQGYQTTLEDIQLLFDSVSVWTKVCLKLPDIQELDTEIKNDDAFYAHPNKNRFDTILINISNSSNNLGLKGELY